MPDRASIVAILVALTGLIMLVYLFTPRRSPEEGLEAPTASTEAVSVAQLPAPATPAPATPAPVEPVPSAEMAVDEPSIDAGREIEQTTSAIRGRQRQLVMTIKDWLGAWSEQRVEDYLDHYAQSFTPPGDVARRTWESQRRERISAPSFIRVSMTALETKSTGADRARATFLQYYRSDGYTDTVRKTLDLVWEDGRWLIESESSESAP